MTDERKDPQESIDDRTTWNRLADSIDAHAEATNQLLNGIRAQSVLRQSYGQTGQAGVEAQRKIAENVMREARGLGPLPESSASVSSAQTQPPGRPFYALPSPARGLIHRLGESGGSLNKFLDTAPIVATAPRFYNDGVDPSIVPEPGTSASGSLSTAGIPPTMQGWQRSVVRDTERMARLTKGFSVPQIGTMTLQNKLEVAGSYATRSAIQSQDEERTKLQQTRPDLSAEQIEEIALQKGSTRGKIGGVLEGAAASVGYLHPVHEALKNQRAEWGARQQTQVQLGYEPGAEIGFAKGIGIRLPDLSKGGAASEAIRNKIDAWQIGLGAGISSKQAGEMIDALNAEGFSGDKAREWTKGPFKDLIKQGVGQETIAGLASSTLRQGTWNVDLLTKSIDGLGKMARKSNLSTDEYIKGMEEYAEVAVGLGQQKGRAMIAARGFGAATGILPQHGAAAMQAPFVKGQAMAMYNVLPDEVGLLTGGQQAKVQAESFRTLKQLYAPLGNRPIYETLSSGKKIMTATGNERVLAQIASEMGLDPAVAAQWEKLGMTPKKMEAQANAMSIAEEGIEEKEQAKTYKHKGTLSSKNKRTLEILRKKAEDNPNIGGYQVQYETYKRQMADPKNREGEYTDAIGLAKFNKERQAKWGDMDNELKLAGVPYAVREKLRKKDDPYASTQRYLEDRIKNKVESENVFTLKLTPKAAKLVDEEMGGSKLSNDARDARNSGATPSAGAK